MEVREGRATEEGGGRRGKKEEEGEERRKWKRERGKKEEEGKGEGRRGVERRGRGNGSEGREEGGGMGRDGKGEERLVGASPFLSREFLSPSLRRRLPHLRQFFFFIFLALAAFRPIPFLNLLDSLSSLCLFLFLHYNPVCLWQ